MYVSLLQYLSVGHPPYYKGLDYIYEDRGEVHFLFFKHCKSKIFTTIFILKAIIIGAHDSMLLLMWVCFVPILMGSLSYCIHTSTPLISLTLNVWIFIINDLYIKPNKRVWITFLLLVLMIVGYGISFCHPSTNHAHCDYVISLGEDMIADPLSPRAK